MSVKELKAQIEELKNELEKYKSSGKREKIQKMSAEVVDSNPYSRLVSIHFARHRHPLNVIGVVQ